VSSDPQSDRKFLDPIVEIGSHSYRLSDESNFREPLKQLFKEDTTFQTSQMNTETKVFSDPK
jgi:hypothetical protein